MPKWRCRAFRGEPFGPCLGSPTDLANERGGVVVGGGSLPRPFTSCLLPAHPLCVGEGLGVFEPSV